MSYLFTSESVSKGHPDKVADQISDALLDEFLRRDPEAKVACETMVTTGLTFCAGEVKTTAYVDVQTTAREAIREAGYTKGEYMFSYDSCGVISAIHEQSPDINRGVERSKPEEQGAGDQGMMFGYACNDSDSYMPFPIDLANRFIAELTRIREEGRRMKYLRPDAKVQVTVEYNDKGKIQKVHTLVFSVQHDEMNANAEITRKMIEDDIRKIIIPNVVRRLPSHTKKYMKKNYKLFVNPTGQFIIGGPHGDTGLTGRKVVVDTYGGMCPHGGGAFSGKDPSKVDRSGAYAARHIAKNIVAAGLAKKCSVQIAYVIGVAKPVSLCINTEGTSIRQANNRRLPDTKIAQVVMNLFDLTPYGIISRFQLKNPIYHETAERGHFGINSYEDDVEVIYDDETLYDKYQPSLKKIGDSYYKRVCFYPWEKLDYVEQLRQAFGLPSEQDQ